MKLRVRSLYIKYRRQYSIVVNVCSFAVVEWMERYYTVEHNHFMLRIDINMHWVDFSLAPNDVRFFYFSFIWTCTQN